MVVTATASARPRGTIVRSGWNCPGEPTPTASLPISANPGRSLQIAADRCPISRAAVGIGVRTAERYWRCRASAPA